MDWRHVPQGPAKPHASSRHKVGLRRASFSGLSWFATVASAGLPVVAPQQGREPCPTQTLLTLETFLIVVCVRICSLPTPSYQFEAYLILLAATPMRSGRSAYRNPR